MGTQGLPIGSMEHFASLVTGSKFENELSQYCLPVLEPRLATCSSIETEGKVEYVCVTSRHDTFMNIDLDTYDVTINPGTKWNQTYVLTSSHYGVMSLSRSKKPEDTSISVFTGSRQYADLLSRLSVGQPLAYTNATYNQTHFTLLCDTLYNSQPPIYSWQWVNFTLDGGVMSVTSTNTTCPNNTSRNPMGWLDYALEDATALTNLGDGYSKLINIDYLAKSGADFERMEALGVSPLDHIVSHVIAIVGTAWTATNAGTARTTAVEWRTYEHRYVISVELTGITILALIVSCLILLATLWQAWRWRRPVLSIKTGRVTGGLGSQ